MQPFTTNIEAQTLENNNFRKVLFTAKHMQLVVMCLKPGEEIGMEVHHNVDQFFRIEQGSAQAVVDDESYTIQKEGVLIVPAGSNHNIINNLADDLKLYTIYSPPNHPEGTVHSTKAEAEESEKAGH